MNTKFYLEYLIYILTHAECLIIFMGIILIVSKIKKSDEYIPFGPFIVIATFISIFVPFDILLKTLLVIFTLGTYKAV